MGASCCYPRSEQLNIMKKSDHSCDILDRQKIDEIEA
jgi:hypothetical protein